ncbi:MAG: RAMP superfamily CRISPR-associated protein [Nitrococcus sp.]|nr:RAMP superfamily CRISPR-associated protein [Nitrococcus sp.]
MTQRFWEAAKSRRIRTRTIIEGDLRLDTPACLGNGETDDILDLPLLADPLKNLPLLTGASIAGALRAYLVQWEGGYSRAKPPPLTEALFGGERGGDKGLQSALIVDDALGKTSGIELRSGNKLNAKSRTAEDQGLYDMQLWSAGTTFGLRFELLVRDNPDPEQVQIDPALCAYSESELNQALATALTGLERGEITLGARKRRGLGRVRVINWRMRRHDLRNPADLLHWLEHGNKKLNAPDDAVHESTEIKQLLGVSSLLRAKREYFKMRVTCSLDGSLLIAGSGGALEAPDRTHLHSRRAGSADVQPILPGTSLGGALRGRAKRIANTLARHDACDSRHARDLVEGLFGREHKDLAQTPLASRIALTEEPIQHTTKHLVQKRVRIDRFTGGAFPTALFNEQPVFGDSASEVELNIHLREPQDHEIGLLLLLLKDLWTGDLPVGGGQGVGRGRLQGKKAVVTLRQGQKALLLERTWVIQANGRILTITQDGVDTAPDDAPHDQLDRYVSQSLRDYFRGEQQEACDDSGEQI